MAVKAGATIDLNALKIAGEPNKYVTMVNGEGIRVHEAGAVNTNFAQINSSGMQIYKGGTSDNNIVASFGDSVRIGKEAYGHVLIDSDGLYVKANDDGSTVSGSADVSYITSNGVHIGNDVTRIFSTHNPDAFSGEGANTSWFECHSSNGIDSVVYAQTGIHAIADTLNRESSVTVHASDDTGNTYTIITGDDLYIESNTSISGSLTLGSHDSPVGTVKRAEPSAAVSVPNNTWKALCSISLEAGTWIVVCTVRAPSNATGYRSANLGNSGQAAVNACVAAASGNVTQFDFTKIISPTETTSYYLNVWQNSGSALSYPTGSTNYITAIRIL